MRILLTGGTGMVGSAFNRIETKHEIIGVGSKQYDLKDFSVVDKMLSDIRPDAIIHLAARVGGVKGNRDYVADFYSENIRMNTNILELAYKHNISKVLSLLSTCIYPDKATYPLTEDQIHTGKPHPSNFGYAYAKRMLDVHSRALREQHGCDFICAVPNNIYGINDYFDLEKCHVIPAIMRKIWEAKKTGISPVFWGDGTPLREFTYSEDVARILMKLLEEYSSPDPINICSSNEVSISQVVEMIADNMNYDGEIIWDTSKPSGQFRKPSSNEKFLDFVGGEFDYTSLQDGLRITCEWFKSEYPNLRGI